MSSSKSLLRARRGERLSKGNLFPLLRFFDLTLAAHEQQFSLCSGKIYGFLFGAEKKLLFLSFAIRSAVVTFHTAEDDAEEQLHFPPMNKVSFQSRPSKTSHVTLNASGRQMAPRRTFFIKFSVRRRKTQTIHSSCVKLGQCTPEFSPTRFTALTAATRR